MALPFIGLCAVHNVLRYGCIELARIAFDNNHPSSLNCVRQPQHSAAATREYLLEGYQRTIDTIV